VSCPDWIRLVARRDGAPRLAAESEAAEIDWLSAVEHLDSCPSCERAALAADPTLVFRRLGPLDLSPAEESAEVESVRRAVAAMRTGRRLERASHAASSGRHWRRYAAAAVLAAAALSLGVEHHPGGAALGSAALGPAALSGLARRPTPATPAIGAIGTILPAAVVTPAAAYPTYGEADGAMEDLNRPKARVYQLHGRHLQVVMIVDEKLDV
jgi:hypothetical protein